MDNCTFIGDQGQLEFTKVSLAWKVIFANLESNLSCKLYKICQKLGWKGKGTEYDVLPLVLQANGQKPELYELPKELIMEVPLSHPE